METEEIRKLNQRAYDMELLYRFCVWLEDFGYLDGDYWAEKPTAVDEFMEIKYDSIKMVQKLE
jgi:hypothetical protein